MRMMLRLAFINKVIRRGVATFITTLPIIIGLIALWVCINQYLENYDSVFPRYKSLLDGEVKENQGLAIEMINEINKFLISANSALFGLSGFFLNNYKHKIALFRNGLAYLLALLLLGCGYFFAFRVYTELLSNLSQDALDIDPDFSRISFFLKMEFKVCCSSCLILLSLFVSVFFYEKKEGPDETSQKEPLPEKEAYNPSIV
jgi:hypothetical protein